MQDPAPVQLVDLHNHTDRSYDASLRLEHYEAAFAEGRFDVVAITDHNRIDGAVELAEHASFPVIVGLEVDTADGELIGLFLSEPVPAGLPAHETAERIKSQGGLVYLPHPFYRLVRAPLRSPVRDRLAQAGLVDVVEGRNGGPFTRGADARARAWAAQRGLVVGAGSDAHDPPDVGTCCVRVPAGPLEARSLLERLRAGSIVDRHRGSLALLATRTHFRLLAELRRLAGAPRQRRLP